MRAATLALFLAALLAAPPATAALTAAELARAELAPPPGARLPPDLPLRDAANRPTTPAAVLAGRPGVLVLVDYTCGFLCGTAIGMASAALEDTGLTPGRDFVLLVLGIDPRDGPAEMAAFRDARGAMPAGTAFLTGDARALAAAQSGIGYRAQFDEAADQFAHPLGALILTAGGDVTRALGGPALDAAALRLALVEAGDGRVGTLGERIRLLCYGFDAATGVYGAMVERALTAGSLVTVAGLGTFLLLLTRRARQR